MEDEFGHSESRDDKRVWATVGQPKPAPVGDLAGLGFAEHRRAMKKITSELAALPRSTITQPRTGSTCGPRIRSSPRSQPFFSRQSHPRYGLRQSAPAMAYHSSTQPKIGSLKIKPPYLVPAPFSSTANSKKGPLHPEHQRGGRRRLNLELSSTTLDNRSQWRREISQRALGSERAIATSRATAGG